MSAKYKTNSKNKRINYSEVDMDKEVRKGMLVLMGVAVFMVLMAFLMVMIRRGLK